jgi:SAM-dependent methyltransferase
MRRFVHWIASKGWVYDRIQRIAGVKEVHAHLAQRIPQNSGRILDIGGGTGAIRRLCSPDARYICLDIELPKLKRLVAAVADAVPLLADATRMPVDTGAVDGLICTAFSHHLPDDMLEQAICECARVLRSGGWFVFLDAIHRPDRIASRVLWSADRGSHPHSAEYLTRLLGSRFEIVYSERFTVYHEYFLVVLKKSSG